MPTVDEGVPQLALRSVGVDFDGHKDVLRDVDLAVQSGEFISIIGPSGCGKTTILRLVAGLTAPTMGEVQVAGGPRVAYVFQEPNLLPWRSVTGNIRLPLELRPVVGQEPDMAVRESLDLIGLQRKDARKFPRMLSGGMRMRVSLARALVTHPEILLLDEPFAALDDMLRQQLNEDVLRIWAEQRWTALFVTHNVSEAVFLSQRVVVMRAHPGSVGRIVEVPFSYPRAPSLRGDPEFARLTGAISEQLRESAA
jgi:NitT/TauT family transport system ATP-binding protein